MFDKMFSEDFTLITLQASKFTEMKFPFTHLPHKPTSPRGHSFACHAKQLNPFPRYTNKSLNVFRFLDSEPRLKSSLIINA